MRHIIGLAAASLLLAACQPVRRPDATAHAAAAHETLTKQTGLIHGRAFYLERIALPAGATLDVVLLADVPGHQDIATIARQTFSDLHGPPFEFTLLYDPTHITKGAQLQLRASLRDANGHLEFATAARVPVPANGSIANDIRLVRATTP